MFFGDDLLLVWIFFKHGASMDGVLLDEGLFGLRYLVQFILLFGQGPVFVKLSKGLLYVFGAVLGVLGILHQNQQQIIQRNQLWHNYGVPHIYSAEYVIIIVIMSINWYEEHLEKIVRENQLLKFNNRKKFDVRVVADSITRVFLELFPDIPPLRMNGTNPNALDQQLAYYQKSASIWIAMTKSKLELYEGNSSKAFNQFEREVEPNMKNHLNKSAVEKRELCVLCSNPKGQQIYEQFSLKIARLQKQMNELQQEIRNLEKQEEKYLKQISYLRSITKKLQYQLALQITKEQKKERLRSDQNHTQIHKMAQEIEVWRAEYDRLWKQLQKIKRKDEKSQKAQTNRFDEERQLFNSLCREQIDNGQSASTHNSNIWIVRCDDSEWSYQESQQGSQKKDQTASIR